MMDVSALEFSFLVAYIRVERPIVDRKHVEMSRVYELTLQSFAYVIPVFAKRKFSD
jgi:hypothetical protein